MRRDAVLMLAVVAITLLGMVATSVGQQSDTDQSQQPGMGMMGPGMMGRNGMMGEGMMGGTARHMVYMHDGVAPQYRGQEGPQTVTPAFVQEGAALYRQNCARCHGETGHGDGDGGRNLRPPPANLATAIRMPMLKDEFFLWTVSEGGVPFETGMPAFKDILKTEEIWKIVAFMRGGFPSSLNLNEKGAEPKTAPK